MAEFKLHCFAQSGNAHKSALMLALSGADWEPVFVDFFKGVTRTPEWREALNGMGEVPVLEHGDKKLTQSGVINTYLSRRLNKFGPENEDQELEVLRWMLFDNHKLSGVLGPYRLLNVLAPDAPDPAVMTFLGGRLKSAFGVMDSHLGQQAFLAGPNPTIADFSCAGYIFYPADELGFDMQAEYPNIYAWMERIKAMPGWVGPYELMPGEIFRAER